MIQIIDEAIKIDPNPFWLIYWEAELNKLESAEIEIGARRNAEPPILSTFHGESNSNGPIPDLAILNNV